jgi:cell division protein FtsL
MKKIVLSLSLLVLAAALVSLWHSSHKLRELSTERAQTLGKIEQLTNQLAQLQARNKAISSVPASIDKASEAKIFRQQIQEDAKRNSATSRNQLFHDPKLQALYQEKERARLRANYGLLFRRLKLTREEQDALVEAQVQCTMHGMDVAALAQEKGLLRNDPSIKAQRKEAEARIESQIEAVLGPDGVKVLQAYDSTKDVRNYVASFSSVLSGLGQPLTSSQTEALIHAMTEVAPKGSNGLTSSVTSEQWDQIFARAEKILSPEQWAHFQTTAPPSPFRSRWSDALEVLLTQTAGPRQ